MSRGAEVNKHNPYNRFTALRAAAGEGHVPVIELLMSKGAGVGGQSHQAVQGTVEGEQGSVEYRKEWLTTKSVDKCFMFSRASVKQGQVRVRNANDDTGARSHPVSNTRKPPTRAW